MSVYGKWFRRIVVPTGGYDFGFDRVGADTVTVPAGNYASYLDLMVELQERLQDDDDGDWYVTVSGTGITVVGHTTDAWTWTEATTDDDLEALMGLDGTEEVATRELTTTSAHTHGWYPGTITFGATAGAGEIVGDDWIKDWPDVAAVSGSGRMRRAAPARPVYRRKVGYDLLHKNESANHIRGVDGIERGWVHPVLWYPDRDLGTVDDTGTQGDPHDSPLESSCDYWLVYFKRLPERQINSQKATYRRVDIELQAEPD
jgi:hypothetical protein